MDKFMELVDEAIRYMNEKPYTEESHRRVQSIFNEQQKIIDDLKFRVENNSRSEIGFRNGVGSRSGELGSAIKLRSARRLPT